MLHEINPLALRSAGSFAITNLFERGARHYAMGVNSFSPFRGQIAAAVSNRFLIDNSNPHLLHHFPASQSLRDVGLDESASDDIILREAIDRRLTIVTRNDADFIRLMRDAAKRSGFENCTGDAYGLVKLYPSRSLGRANFPPPL